MVGSTAFFLLITFIIVSRARKNPSLSRRALFS